jgi:hypothetical protein
MESERDGRMGMRKQSKSGFVKKCPFGTFVRELNRKFERVSESDFNVEQ